MKRRDFLQTTGLGATLILSSAPDYLLVKLKP